jgi:diguanylate cyclase (GGDEF)-like protein
MGTELYIAIGAVGVAVVLLIITIVLIFKSKSKGDEIKKYSEENKKLFTRVQKLENAYKDTAISRENLVVMHEELKEQYETVNRLAYTDTLTELPNRQQFNDILEGVMLGLADNPGTRAALTIIKLANYERITNATGRVSADEFILDFTQRLKANLNEDDFLARIGSDEFAIITQNFDTVTECENHIVRINKILRTPLSSGGREVIPDIYVACAKAPTDGQNIQLLTLNVGLALSKATQEKSDTVYFYSEDMADEAMKKMELSAELNRSVAANELNYLYSAQTDLRTGAVASYEIIPVWDCERFGRLLPDEYLKYAEDTQISKKIFTNIFAAACIKQKYFENNGFPDISFIIPCFVGQFIDDDFVNIVYSLLEKSDATPSRLLISVPESVIIKNPQATILLMKKIQKLGIRFVLDDFGSGSSSLKTLINAPVSTVRLSEEFFDGEATVNEEQLMSSMVGLIHSWKMKILVSGIDYKEQEALLKKIKADFSEGQLYNGYMDENIAFQYARIAQKSK